MFRVRRKSSRSSGRTSISGRMYYCASQNETRTASGRNDISAKSLDSNRRGTSVCNRFRRGLRGNDRQLPRGSVGAGDRGSPSAWGSAASASWRRALGQLSQPSVSKLPAFGAKRLPYSVSGMEAINMKWATALVAPSISSAGSKEVTGLKMPPKWVEFGVWFHGVTLPQSPPNQWISSLPVRFAYTRAAALGETMMVV